MKQSLLKYYYEHGVLNKFDMLKFVEDDTISKEEYHSITDFDYDAIKKREDEN